MPSMVLAYAPLLRYDLAEHNGFVALEDSKTARRQTPFAKCDISVARAGRGRRLHHRHPSGPGQV